MPYYRYSRFRSPRRSYRGGGFFDIRRRMRSVDWSAYSLSKFEKKFYEERSSVRERSRRKVENFRSENKVTVLGHNVPRPLFRYSETGFPSYLTDIAAKMGWNSPTPIQCQSWPVVLSGRDIVGIYQSQLGKIATFLLPSLVHIKAQPNLKRGEGPIALILTPDKENVLQIGALAKEFCASAGLRYACLYGGSSKTSQEDQLEQSPELVISTPGRFLDFLEFRKTNLKRCTYLVFDEADQLLEMGYEPSIRRISSQVRPDRQTLLWSNGWPREVKSLAEDFLYDYIQINVGSAKYYANPNARQHVEIITESEKMKRLLAILNSIDSSRTLIFTESKRKRDEVFEALKEKSLTVSCLRDGKPVPDDVDDYRYLINYDYPLLIDDYVARIGKADSDKKKTVYTFFTSRQFRKARELLDLLKEVKQKYSEELLEIAEGRYSCKSKSKERSSRRSRSLSSRSKSSVKCESNHSRSPTRESRSSCTRSLSRGRSRSKNGGETQNRRSKSASRKRDRSYGSRVESRSPSHDSRIESFRKKKSGNRSSSDRSRSPLNDSFKDKQERPSTNGRSASSERSSSKRRRSVSSQRSISNHSDHKRSQNSSPQPKNLNEGRKKRYSRSRSSESPDERSYDHESRSSSKSEKQFSGSTGRHLSRSRSKSQKRGESKSNKRDRSNDISPKRRRTSTHGR